MSATYTPLPAHLVVHACAVHSFQIDKGEIHATIDQANGMVVFHDNPEKFCTDAMAVEIDQQVCT